MSQNKKVFFLLLTMVAIFYTPYIALLIKCGEIPYKFFHFPATEPEPKPGLNLVAVIIISILFLAFLLLVFFPRIYGFRKVPTQTPVVKKEKFPVWFWIGLVMWMTILVLFMVKLSEPKWLMNWALLPLWWGFILMLDGIVYRRNQGRSLVKNALAELIAMGTLSISGWLIFEYFNFFIKLNWYYPAADIMHHDEFLLYAAIGSSAFIPMAFEWYQLLMTFKFMNSRHGAGPRIRYSGVTKIILLVIAFVLFFLMTFFPSSLFYAVWLSPLAIMVIVSSMLNIWTPFTELKTGNWTPLVIFATVWVLQGFCVEWWNHLSYRHSLFSPTYNPGYWDYCVPYVDFGHIFNMPVLGYLGYVPFGIYCGMYTIIMAHIMNIKFPFSISQQHVVVK